MLAPRGRLFSFKNVVYSISINHATNTTLWTICEWLWDVCVYKSGKNKTTIWTLLFLTFKALAIISYRVEEIIVIFNYQLRVSKNRHTNLWSIREQSPNEHIFQGGMTCKVPTGRKNPPTPISQLDIIRNRCCCSISTRCKHYPRRTPPRSAVPLSVEMRNEASFQSSPKKVTEKFLQPEEKAQA